MTHDDVKKLAELSRIHIDEADISGYLADFENILGYINTIQSVDIDDVPRVDSILKNVVRDDDIAYTAGEYTKDLLKSAPQSEHDFIRVQKIL